MNHDYRAAYKGTGCAFISRTIATWEFQTAPVSLQSKLSGLREVFNFELPRTSVLFVALRNCGACPSVLS
ncbi:hypothetical protein [Roseibium sp.]|uniref:hypothetical protein n=1 Tax=Roseibium sp. TaxID=1936156 RepID=UPI003D114650